MTDKFDGMPDGAGKRATEDDYKRIWLYMKSRNRKPSVRSVLVELKAQNYVPPAVASSQRWAKKLGLSETVKPSVTAAADRKANNRRCKQRERAPEQTTEKLAEKTGQTPEQVVVSFKSRMIELLKAENSSTQIAITENRTRMAFNIALMEFYAEKPEQLLANVRDAAAFLDATTIAAKLSGGASIDITLPQGGDQQHPDGISPAGFPMKTVGAQLANVDTSLVDKFRKFQSQMRDGQGA